MGELNKTKEQMEELKVEINGFVSDNENKMKSIRQKIKIEWVDHVGCVGDSSHALQLVIKEILDSSSTKDIVEIKYSICGLAFM